MYAVTISDEGDCYRCFPPDPSIGTAALGACEASALGASASALSGTGEAALSDRTTLTPLGRPVAVSLADPSGGPVLAHFSTVLPCPAAPSGTLSGLYLPSFSTNLVSGADLQDAGFTSLLLRDLPVSPVSRGGSELPLTPPSFPRQRLLCRLLHMDVWGPARVRGQGHERYFLLVVDDYSRYTTVFPLRSKGDVTEVLIDWIRAARLQLRRSFGSDFPVLRLHSDRGGEFSSGLLRAYCLARGIRQTFTLPDSPQQNGIAERRIGMVMDVARTSMMHAAAPHFLWPFAVRYAAHQLNLHPRVSRPETSPALLWTGKVGDASAFRVWGSRAFVRDLSADKLSPRAAPCVFLGFPLDAPGWQFYHPSSRRVLSSQDVTFDESVPFYRLFPYRTPSLPPPPHFLVPGPPPVDPLPPQGPAPSGVSQVDAVEPVEVAGDSGTAWGAEPGGAEPGGANSGGAEPGGADSGGAESGGAEPGGAEPGAWGPEPGGAASGAAEPGRVEPAATGPPLVASGGTGPGGSPGVSSRREPLSPQELREWFARRWRRTAGACASSAAEGAGAAGPGAAGPAGPPGAGAAEGVGSETPTVRPGGGRAAGATGAGGGPAAGGAVGAGAARGAEGAGAVLAVPGATARPRPYFVPLLQQVLGLPPLLEGPPLVQSHRTLFVLPVLLVTRLLATVVTDPSFESTAASALVAELVDFAARCRLDYAASLVAEQEEFQCLAAASPHLASVLLAPEGDPDALDIPTPRSYAEAVEGPYSSQWQAAMDAEMASSKSTGTYVDAVPPPGANIVSGMWIFMVKRPPGLSTCLQGAPFYILVYIDDLVFATADTAGLAYVKSELQKRHTCTDLGELRSYLGLQITRDRARRTITLTQSHMVQQVLQRFSFTYSSPQATPLSTRHSLSALPSDESVESSGPYPELVGCLMYLMTCTST
ncbi:unnamed protein product [Closterium sp. NIES-65]|nr:unnamed protein product [Closterium sp. NIES-65]